MGDGSEIRNNLGDVYYMGPNWRILAWNAFLMRVTARLKRVSAVHFTCACRRGFLRKYHGHPLVAMANKSVIIVGIKQGSLA
jgi:hypothetical protein